MGRTVNGENVLSAQEASQFLGCHIETIYRLIKKGVLSSRKYGKNPRRVFVTEDSAVSYETAIRIKQPTRSTGLLDVIMRLQHLEQRLDRLEYGSQSTSKSSSSS